MAPKSEMTPPSSFLQGALVLPSVTIHFSYSATAQEKILHLLAIKQTQASLISTQ